jgi:iron complex outermembrane receptor protein
MIALLLTLLRPANTIAQDVKEIKGTITDSKGIPAAGVTVSVKGANFQTLTNEAGAFTGLDQR